MSDIIYEQVGYIGQIENLFLEISTAAQSCIIRRVRTQYYSFSHIEVNIGEYIQTTNYNAKVQISIVLVQSRGKLQTSHHFLTYENNKGRDSGLFTISFLLK